MMAQQNNVTEQSPNQLSAGKPMLIGAVIGLILISLFVFGADSPKPEWGKLWMIRPLLIVPLAGAMGGFFYYLMNFLSSKGKVNKTLAFLLSFVVFIISLWLGTVLGLAGTMWN